MINAETKQLIRYICNGNIKKAQQQARIIVNADTTEKNRSFREEALLKLDALEGRSTIELPYNLKSLLIAEAPDNYSDGKFLLRDTERAVVEKVLKTYQAANKLADLRISYLPTLILYGKSGCGKTELARYIAHKASLPFLYVNFSNLIDSHLGGTQKNLAQIFDFVRTTPCLLCFDEIDTIGLVRGSQDDVGEMSRIVISVMQEMDRLPNNVIIVGTTNRFGFLDPALIRRFSLQHEVTPLSCAETVELCDKFFGYAGIKPSNMDGWLKKNDIGDGTPTYTVIKACTEYIINRILEA